MSVYEVLSFLSKESKEFPRKRVMLGGCVHGDNIVFITRAPHPLSSPTNRGHNTTKQSRRSTYTRVTQVDYSSTIYIHRFYPKYSKP